VGISDATVPDVMREIIGRAPTRIDLGGGWTDVPPYCDREGGFVCNIAINRYALVRLSDTLASDASDQSPIVRAALRRAGLNQLTASIASDFPVGAGLGGSSAVSAALLGAIAQWKREPIDRTSIAEAGRSLEVEELGIAGGRQDHYAATYGGALALTFTRATAVRRISLSVAVRDELCARAVLIYTGQSRISGDTITAVLGAYKQGEPTVLRALRRMRELAEAMADALEGGDIDALGRLLGEHWRHQRSLHPSIPTERIDEIVLRAQQAGALGAKAMGASGGGCVLVLCAADSAEAVRRAIQPLGELLDFRFDDGGVTVEEST